MWVASSELSVHHCFSSLFHFLIPSQAKAQSPGEISHPAQCDEGNACGVCVRACLCACVWAWVRVCVHESKTKVNVKKKGQNCFPSSGLEFSYVSEKWT